MPFQIVDSNTSCRPPTRLAVGLGLESTLVIRCVASCDHTNHLRPKLESDTRAPAILGPPFPHISCGTRLRLLIISTFTESLVQY